MVHTSRLQLHASTGSTRPYRNAVIFGNASAVTPGPPAAVPGIKDALNNLALAATNNNTTINVLVESSKQMAALLAALLAKMDSIGAVGVQPAPLITTVPRNQNKNLTIAQWFERGYDPAGYCWLHGY